MRGRRLYHDRADAGRALARSLERYRKRQDVLILALPRGGVPVAAEAAKALELPMDVLLVRKLPTPGNPELAMGAISAGGVRVLNPEVVREFGITEDEIQSATEIQQCELEHRGRLYRGDWPPTHVRGQVVILIDDGLATGSTMRAAIAALRTLDPAALVVAVPTAPAETVAEIAKLADEVVCPHTPSPFVAIGPSYEDFPQVSDHEVQTLLRQSGVRATGSTPPEMSAERLTSRDEQDSDEELKSAQRQQP